MENNILIECHSKRERDIIFDIIREHELIDALYVQELKTEKANTQILSLFKNQLTRNLYRSLTGRSV